MIDMIKRSFRIADGESCRSLGVVGLLMAGVMLASGCNRQPFNAEALRKEALQADPAFAEALNKHDELANRVLVLKRELDLKRTQIEGQISALRAELRDTTAAVNRNIDSTKALLNPTIERIELSTSLGAEDLRAKERQRSQLGRSISRLRKQLKQSGEQTSTEQAQMTQQLTEMLQETQRLDQEIAALKEHLRILKMKRLLLRW